MMKTEHGISSSPYLCLVLVRTMSFYVKSLTSVDVATRESKYQGCLSDH